MSDRPPECIGCRQFPSVVYREITGDVTHCLHMCVHCPVLEQKLHGHPVVGSQKDGGSSEESQSGICCMTCGTTLRSVEMGGLLGCTECYCIFGDKILEMLIDLSKLPEHVDNQQKSLHCGPFPDRSASLSPSNQILSLATALQDALQRENYEQAARLRDQIKEFTKQSYE